MTDLRIPRSMMVGLAVILLGVVTKQGWLMAVGLAVFLAASIRPMWRAWSDPCNLSPVKRAIKRRTNR